MLETFRKLDLFAKASDEFRVKTNSGALVSIISFILMITLLCFEINYFLKVEIVDHLYVNTTRSDTLSVNFDISFPEIPCGLLSIDAADEAGLPQRTAIFQVKKHKIGKDFEKLGVPMRSLPGNSIKTEDELLELAREKKSICGNCYGAGRPDECCNTCEEVKLAYVRVGWQFRPQGIKQCEDDTDAQMPEELSEDGGCRMYGRLQLSQTSGHFHIVPHRVLQEAAGVKSGLMDFLELISNAFSQFNITHNIHDLNFGDSFPGIKYPLNDQARNPQDTHGMYQYYIKVVPTIYKDLRGKEIVSNQFAVTEHMRHLQPGSGRGLPGVYFNYELSPIQAKFEERRGHGGVLRLFTSVCAIVGGSFTLLGIVDAVVTTVGKVGGSLL